MRSEQDFHLDGTNRYGTHERKNQGVRGPVTPSTEAALVEQARRGDAAAFSELVSRYERKIYNLAYRLTGHPEDAMDMAQEAFVRVYTSLPDFRGDASFATWLHRIAANACMDELRKRKRQRLTYLDAPVETEGREELARQLADANDGPEDTLMRQEMQRTVQLGIRALDPDYRTVLVMRDIQGHSYEEISAWLQLPLGTVKSRLSRARNALKDLLQKVELLGPQFVYSSRRRKSSEL